MKPVPRRIAVALSAAVLAVLAPEAGAVPKSGRDARSTAPTPVIGRATPALLARCFPPARAGGQGAAFGAGVDSRAVFGTLGLATVVVGPVLGTVGLLALLVAGLVALLFAGFFARRLGGITGDVLGAGVEAAELAALLTVAAWAHAAR